MIKIINGTIIDGSGKEAHKADLLIDGGKIAKICSPGAISENCEKTIDAGGKFVTPGFVDIHRHADVAIFKEGFGGLELMQGITTVVNGNCGLSAAPDSPEFSEDKENYLRPITGSTPEGVDISSFGSLFKAAEETALALNVGFLAGNGSIRMATTGFRAGSLSEEEKGSAREKLREALESGVLGISLGLAYIPENNYSYEELIEVLEPARGSGLPLCVHMRGEGASLYKAIKEVCDVALELGLSLNISHMKVVGREFWGKAVKGSFDIMKEYENKGVRMSCDVYPYPAGSTTLAQVLPAWVQAGGTDVELERLSDPELRKKIREDMINPPEGTESLVHSIGWDRVMITGAELEKNRKFIGLRVPEAAVLAGKDPFDFTFDILTEERLNVPMVSFSMMDSDVMEIMKHPYTSIISDSLYSDSGLPHPRKYGSFTEFLSKYLRDEKIMPLEEGIFRCTSKPAAVLGISGKGLIEEGADADICVFDLAKIRTDATFADPLHLSEGMDCVMIGGELAVEDGKLTGKKNGRLIRRLPH